jgi:hypothetical protein
MLWKVSGGVLERIWRPETIDAMMKLGIQAAGDQVNGASVWHRERSAPFARV